MFGIGFLVVVCFDVVDLIYFFVILSCYVERFVRKVLEVVVGNL